MTYCVNPGCRRKLDPRQCFCQYCGADNRPPESRYEAEPCQTHYFLDRRPYCVRCGEPAGEIHGYPRRKRILAVRIQVSLSILVGLFALGMFMASMGMRLPLLGWIKRGDWVLACLVAMFAGLVLGSAVRTLRNDSPLDFWLEVLFGRWS